MNEQSPESLSVPFPKRWALPFFTIWSGQAMSLLGSQMVQFALVWWLTKATGSATVLATATLVAMLPQVFLGPIAGVVVDRFSRRWVMALADALSALAVVVLAALFWTNQVQVWHIYALMFIRSAAQGFHWPAMQSSTSLMVPKEHLSRIQGLNQMLFGAMNIFSAPLAALLVSAMPMQGVLAIDVSTALLAITPLLFIAVPQPPRSVALEAGEKAPSMFSDLRAGFRYVWTWPGLMMILVMATVINLMLTPSGALQPILVTRHFSGGALQLAWMESAWGVGAVVGGLTLSAWGGFRRRIVTSMAALILLGVGVLAVGFVPASMFWLAVVLMFLVGFTNPIVNGPLFAVVQAVVAPDMQGRVFTLISSFATAMTPIGLLFAGPIADRLGVQTWYVIGGVITASLGVLAFFIPAIMNIESDKRDQAKDAAVELNDNEQILPGKLAKISGD
ncbi:MAG: MFS transporter [Anaerolineales bacterium]|nr:MFS transporter [Anaerolineales bacterium]